MSDICNTSIGYSGWAYSNILLDAIKGSAGSYNRIDGVTPNMESATIDYLQIVETPIEHEMRLFASQNNSHGFGEIRVNLKLQHGEIFFYGATKREANACKRKFIKQMALRGINAETQELADGFSDFAKTEPIISRLDSARQKMVK